MFTIYGLRLIDAHEVRYVGQSKDVDKRLLGHFACAKGMPLPTAFAIWLCANEGGIEWFEIDSATTREDARQAERQAIEYALRFGHRLFNHHHVPADKRITDRGPLRSAEYFRARRLERTLPAQGAIANRAA